MSNLLPSLQNSLISFYWPAQTFDPIRHKKEKFNSYVDFFIGFDVYFLCKACRTKIPGMINIFPFYKWLCYWRKIYKFTQNVIDIQGCFALISAFNSLIFVLINLVYVLHHPNTRIKKQLRFPCHKHCKHHSWSKLCKYVFVLCLCHVHFKYIDRKVDWFMHIIMKKY